MSAVPDPSRSASPELLILGRVEELAAWLIEHTGKWPRAHRFTFAQRVQNLTLDVLEATSRARYSRSDRIPLLLRVNVDLERLRHLLRLAERLRIMPSRAFERAMEALDEVGRMAYGWRTAREAKQPIQQPKPRSLPGEEVAP